VPAAIEAALIARTNIASGVFDLVFAMKSPNRLDFRAGQFVTLRVPSGTRDGFLRRSYSIASPTHAGEQIRFIVREVPGGQASDFLLRLPLGQSIAMAGPYGVFALEPSHPGDVVFGATGTGLAAVMPMLEELVRAPERVPGRRFVHWGLRREQDIFARDEIEELCRRSGAELSIHLTAAGPDWQGRRGRVSQSILGIVATLRAPTFYLVGNGAMISETKSALIQLGVDRKRHIRTEAFFD
jgi:CDP-4-dehydro-6-deoxyglucose reductase